MTSWSDFTDAEPELAERARLILASTVNAVLGTLRADGMPRLSGIDPFFLHGELWIGSMPDARKGADLRRDPRCSLHSIPWESRKLRPDAADGGEADVKVAAHAVRLGDAADQAEILAWFKEERDMEPAADADLFRLDLDAVTVISVDHDANELVVDHWTEAGGRITTRRD